MIVDDFDDLLTGTDGLENVLANALILNATNEFASDLEVNISGEESGSDFLQRFSHILLAQLRGTAKVAHGIGKFIAQAFEHSPNSESPSQPL